MAESLHGHLAHHFRLFPFIHDDKPVSQRRADDVVFPRLDLAIRHPLTLRCQPKDLHNLVACVEDLQLRAVQCVKCHGVDE